jgi:hypothetical protein
VVAAAAAVATDLTSEDGQGMAAGGEDDRTELQCAAAVTLAGSSNEPPLSMWRVEVGQQQVERMTGQILVLLALLLLLWWGRALGRKYCRKAVLVVQFTAIATSRRDGSGDLGQSL